MRMHGQNWFILDINKPSKLVYSGYKPSKDGQIYTNLRT